MKFPPRMGRSDEQRSPARALRHSSTRHRTKYRTASTSVTGFRALPSLAFEVVYKRPTKPGTNWMMSSATTPDGYRVTGQSLWFTIMIAYFPQGMAYWSKQRLSGAPPWLGDLYDIDAKVSESDLADWQKQGMSLDKKVMLQQMLQTMLADRCHLVAHRIPGGEISGFSLEIGKRGLISPRLNLMRPFRKASGCPTAAFRFRTHTGEKPHMSFYGATMADFASQLSHTLRRSAPSRTTRASPAAMTSWSTGSVI